MRLFLFLILIGAIAFLYFYFSKREDLLKHQLLISEHNNRKLKDELSKYSKLTKNNFCFTFSIPSESGGILNKNTKIYLCPIENSLVLYTTSLKMEVHIIDKCFSNCITWYYISFLFDNCTSSRGWVNKNDFSLFFDDTLNLPKST